MLKHFVTYVLGRTVKGLFVSTAQFRLSTGLAWSGEKTIAKCQGRPTEEVPMVEE